MAKRSVQPFRPVYPSPAALITAVSEDGKANIITLGEVYNLSIAEPVIIGISIAKPRYTHELITRTGEFVVNLPSARILEKVDRCGSVSGHDVDKFAAFGLTALPATQVRPPLIAECPVNLECRLLGHRGDRRPRHVQRRSACPARRRGSARCLWPHPGLAARPTLLHHGRVLVGEPQARASRLHEDRERRVGRCLGGHGCSAGRSQT